MAWRSANIAMLLLGRSSIAAAAWDGAVDQKIVAVD